MNTPTLVQYVRDHLTNGGAAGREHDLLLEATGASNEYELRDWLDAALAVLRAIRAYVDDPSEAALQEISRALRLPGLCRHGWRGWRDVTQALSWRDPGSIRRRLLEVLGEGEEEEE